ncbi:MAG: tetratricopeptide repeat protein [Kiritimatiellia bacterium]
MRRAGSIWVVGVATVLLFIGALPGRAQSEDALQRELNFCSALVKWRFSDYATRLVDNLEKNNPSEKGRLARVRVEILTSQGKADEARALIKTFPPDSTATYGMLLALGDSLYGMGKLNEAKAVYRGFFANFEKGPPPEIAKFYQESAYKYSQMMAMTGNDKEALLAYEFVLLSKPEPDVERRLQIEMAELCLKVGRQESGKVRDDYFARAKKLCELVQWKGLDLWFGQSVVILAHIEQLKGNRKGAMDTITTYLPMLKELDDALKAENYPLKLSPMAQCRYILGTLYEDEARALIVEEKKDEAVKAFGQALNHLYNVFVKYPDSTWAPDAGARAERMATDLKDMGFKVKLPEINLAPVIEAQLKEARLLFSQQDFKAACAKYLTVLNVFPEQPGSVQSLGELGQCYLNLQDKLFMRVVVQELSDRYGARANFRDDAGTALVRLARAAEEINDNESLAFLNQLFFEKFSDHKQVPSMLYQSGERQLEKENYDLAVSYYSQVAQDYTNASVYLASLNRLSLCYTKRGDWSNAVDVLTRYTAELPFGPQLASARFRLADANRQVDRLIPAINEYFKLIKGLTEEEAKYASTPDEKAANRKLLEQAMFWKAYCYSRLREPADKVSSHQAQAAEDYAAFLKMFPKSELSPSALSSRGVLLLILNRNAEAAECYDRLSREFPQSEQARNAVFARGTSLLEMGQKDQAAKVFEEMFASPGKFGAPQFYQAGRVMLEQNENGIAIRAFEQALRGKPEKALEEALRYYLGMAYSANGDTRNVIRHLEALKALNASSGFTVEAGFLLSKAYATMGKQETAEEPRLKMFNSAIRVMNQASRLMTKPEERARRDFELAGIQILKGDPESAIASHQRLVLLSDYGNAKVRPVIEQAFEAVMPLLLERDMNQDLMDNATLYLQQFPNGRLMVQARQWREKAQQKMAMAGAAPVAP